MGKQIKATNIDELERKYQLRKLKNKMSAQASRARQKNDVALLMKNNTAMKKTIKHYITELANKNKELEHTRFFLQYYVQIISGRYDQRHKTPMFTFGSFDNNDRTLEDTMNIINETYSIPKSKEAECKMMVFGPDLLR